MSGATQHGRFCQRVPAEAPRSKSDSTYEKAGAAAAPQVAPPARRIMGFGAAAVQIALAGAADSKNGQEPDEAEQILGTMSGWGKSIANGDDLSSCF